MSTARKRKQNSEARQAKKALKAEVKNMISVFVKLGCGCHEGEVNYPIPKGWGLKLSNLSPR